MIRAIGLCVLGALLASCIANRSFTGEDNQSPPPSHGVSVTPAEATVAAGATRQFTAKADNGSAVTWQVTGVTGGNAQVGTISSSGLYTAPSLPPAGGSVTVTAISKTDASLTGSASVTIHYSNASLRGAYVFSWRGQSGGPFGVIGRFEADGNGGINSGREDVNAPAGVTLNLEFNGSYDIADNGTGQAVFVSPRGRAELRFVLGADGRARIIRVDSGATAAGVVLPQVDSEVTTGTVAGDHVFRIAGLSTTGLPIATVGRFTADDDGDIGSGLADRNHGGAVARAVKIAGAYDLGDNGHGSLTLTSALGTRHYAFYIASAGDIRLLRIDQGFPLTGKLLGQADMNFGDGDLAGDYAFYLSGDNGVNRVATAGLFTADSGNIGDGVFNRSDSVMLEQASAFTGAYAIGDSGRGAATFFSSGGQTELAFYMQSPHHAVALEIDAVAVRSGEFIAQSGDDFSAATLDGPYTLASAGAGNPVAGRLVFNGDGDISDGVEAVASTPQAVALGGSYSLENTGRGQLVLRTEGGGEQDYIIYVIDPARSLLLGVGTSAMPLGWLRRQWPAKSAK